MNYDERLERLEKMNEKAVDLLKTLLEIESIQSRSLKRHEETLTIQNGSLNRHEELLNRIETNLAEATDKLNALISREMKREGGPEAAS